MRRNWIPLLLLVIAAVLAVVFWDGKCSATAEAALRPQYPISKGERGQRVCDALWLMSGRGKPAVRTGARWHIYRGPIRKGRSCVWNKAAQKAAIKVKYRLGYKQWQISSTFSRKLRAYLRGERKRPRVYLELASKRVVLEKKLAAKEAWAQRLIDAERRELGVRETSNNYSSRIRLYLLISGIRGSAPWCMAFQQWGRVTAGLNTVAYRTAHVFTFVSYAQRRGWIRAKPAPGYHVAFMERSGHVGLVWKVFRTGIQTLEGNSQNSVRTRFIPHGSRRLIYIRADDKAR